MPPGDSAVIAAGSTMTVASYSRPLVDIGSTTLTRPDGSPASDLSEPSHGDAQMTAMEPSTSTRSASTVAAAAGTILSGPTEVMIGATPVSRTAFGMSASGTSARITSA